MAQGFGLEEELQSRLYGTVPPPFKMPPEVLKREKPPKGKRQLSVTLVALYQLLRAVFLLTVVANLWGDSEADMASHAGLRTLIYLVTQRNIARQEPPVTLIMGIVSLLGAYYAATGVGLWVLNKWARRATIFMSAAAMIRLLFFFVLMQADKQAIPDSQQLVFAVFLLLDLFIVASLVNEGQAFGVQG